MSYDKGKTIREYMQGGYAQSMGYSNGGYIPGVSSSLFRAGITRDVGQAQSEQREQMKALAEQEKKRGWMSKLGSIGGTLAGGALAAALAPITGGASLAAGAALAKGLGSAGGSFLGEKLAEGTTDTSGVGKKSSTGLLGSGFKELGDMKSQYSKGVLGRSLATGVQTGLMAGGSDYLKAHGKGMMGKGLSKLGIDPNKIMGGAPPVAPELLDASQYTDQIMANVPTPTPTLGTIGGAGGASSAFNLGENISNIGRGLGLERFKGYPDISSYGSYTPINQQQLSSSFIGPPQMFNQGGSILPKGIAPGGERSYRRGAGLDYLDQVMNQRAEGNALRDAFKMADENKDIILGQARQRIADEDARDMQTASILRDLGEVNRAEQDIAMAQEGSANLAQRAQSGQGMEYTNQIRDLLGTMQEGTERDLSFDSMNKIYPEGMESARTDRFGGQTFSAPEIVGVGMEEEGDDALLSSLLGRTLGADAGGLTSGNIGNILEELAMANQANRNRSSDILNPKRPGIEFSYKRRGYAGGGLINMLPFNRRVM